MKKSFWARCRTNFLTGAAIVLPAVVSVAVVVWVFRNVSNVTDVLLFFLPRSLTHESQGAGPVIWYWSFLALCMAVVLIGLVGQLARHYLGQQIIEVIDTALSSVPLLNKIYVTIKQVNDAFSPENKSGFKQVVVVEFPRPGSYSVGFLTSGPIHDLPVAGNEKMASVFVPTTPNPTGGFLLLLPESQIIKLDMSVADGIKYVISLGAIAPEGAHQQGSPATLKPLAQAPRSRT